MDHNMIAIGDPGQVRWQLCHGKIKHPRVEWSDLFRPVEVQVESNVAHAFLSSVKVWWIRKITGIDLSISVQPYLPPVAPA
jgi:hypothetical protein